MVKPETKTPAERVSAENAHNVELTLENLGGSQEW